MESVGPLDNASLFITIHLQIEAEVATERDITYQVIALDAHVVRSLKGGRRLRVGARGSRFRAGSPRLYPVLGLLSPPSLRVT